MTQAGDSVGPGVLRALRHSLAVRVAVAVLLTQVVVVNLGLVAMFVARAWHDPAAIEGARVMRAVRGALKRGPDGALTLTETDDLRAIRLANPSVRIAALDARTGALAAGSDPSSARLLRVLQQENLVMLNFIADETEVGGKPALIEFYADRWSWTALPHAMLAATRSYAITFTAISLVVSAATTGVILVGLAPLRRAAAALRGTDAELPGTLAALTVPVEIRPFVEAVERAVRLVRERAAREQRFLADAAHELRTPLAVLRARIDRLGDPEEREALREDAAAMARVVSQLLSLSRLRATSPDPAQNYDALPRLRRLVTDLAPLALAAGRSLALEAADDVTLRGDPAGFDSAVRNVIENALRAAPEGTEVLVRLGPGPELRVTDHGPGIPPAERATVFRPFHRLPGTPGEGAGLGLTIARDAAALHGGGVAIEETPGGGATFVLCFAPPPIG